MSSLISPQILGRYMNAAAWKRVITPHAIYFLSSGLQIAHNFWYSLSSFTLVCEDGQVSGLSKDLNIYFKSGILQVGYFKLLDALLNRNNLQFQQLFSMKIIVLYLALFSIAYQINFRCTPPASQLANSVPKQNEDICPMNSHCLPNGFCECDDGFIGGCSQKAYRLEDNTELSVQVGHQLYTFFQVKGNTQTYTLLLFNLCLVGKIGGSSFNIDFWDDNGTLDVLSKQNAEQGGLTKIINDNCLNLITPFLLFGTKTNGEVEGFILGVKKAQSGTQTIKIKVQITQIDFWGLMVKIIFILGSCFLLVLISAIIYVVYKRRNRQLFMAGNNRQKDISHLDIYMPKIRLSENESRRIASQLCSICLIELGDSHYLRKTVCAHVFHQDCLDSWCRTNLSCPVCRRSFQLDDLKNESQTFDQTDYQSLRQGMLR